MAVTPRFITIGVYGFDSDSFFQALVDAQVQIFCDLRLRRAVRGSTYAFANSQRLQQKLHQLSIRYLHCKELAPSLAVRNLQEQVDKQLHVAKRQRKVLSSSFIQAYEQEHLSVFDWRQFLEQLGPEPDVVALCCVEREPQACHRSLVAQRLEQELGMQVKHIVP